MNGLYIILLYKEYDMTSEKLLENMKKTAMELRNSCKENLSPIYKRCKAERQYFSEILLDTRCDKNTVKCWEIVDQMDEFLHMYEENFREIRELKREHVC